MTSWYFYNTSIDGRYHAVLRSTQRGNQATNGALSHVTPVTVCVRVADKCCCDTADAMSMFK